MGRINMHIPDEVHDKLFSTAKKKMRITLERYVNKILKLAADKGWEKFEKI